MDPPPSAATPTPTSSSTPIPPSLSKKNKDEFQPTCHEEELTPSQVRRQSVHYASIAEFLASLKNVQDKHLCLEDYLRAVRCPRYGDPAKDRRN